MGFTRKQEAAPTTTTKAPTTASAPTKSAGRNFVARKADYVVKIKNMDTGKLERVGGMWKNDDRDGFYLKLNDGITLSSTKEDIVKLQVLPNDYEEKFGKKAK